MLFPYGVKSIKDFKSNVVDMMRQVSGSDLNQVEVCPTEVSGSISQSCQANSGIGQDSLLRKFFCVAELHIQSLVRIKTRYFSKNKLIRLQVYG